MRRSRLPALALAGCAALLAAVTMLGGGTTTAQAGPAANAVLDWNLHASDALINAPAAATPGAGQTTPVSMQHLAIVQGAVYDAVNAIDGGYQPYLAGLSSASAAGIEGRRGRRGRPRRPHRRRDGPAALAGDRQPPRQPLRGVDRGRDDPGRRRRGCGGDRGGEDAAEAMLEKRANDGRYGTFTFTPGSDVGEWRPTSGVIDPFAWVARVDPFVLESTSQFRTKGPHSLTSGAYAKDYNEVKELGGNGTTTPTLRTPEQTALAQFYTVHTVELFNRTFRGIATAEGLTLVEQARLFAMLNMAGADSVINCWDDKAFWNFWRPITAIREGDADGNDKTAGDPTWTSLVPTPPYPDHPSGYNCVTSGFMHAAEAFFGKGKQPFAVTANLGSPPAPVTREYERFTDVIADTIDARIYLGIHFRAPDEQGAEIGKDVAHWLDKHYFRPVG